MEHAVAGDRAPAEPILSVFRTGYDLSQSEIAARYDGITDAITMPPYFYPYVAALASARRSIGRIVDVGCGNGQLLAELARRRQDGVDLVGLEPSFALATSASARLHPRATVVEGSGLDLPFADDSFDLVLLSEVVEHVPRPIRLLSEVRRVLRPDGEVVATMPNMSAYEPFWRIADLIPTRTLRSRLLPSEHPLRTVQPIDTGYVYRAISRLFALAGLEIVAVRGREYFAPWIHAAPLVGGAIWRNLATWDRVLGRLISPRWAYRVVIVAKRRAAAR